MAMTIALGSVAVLPAYPGVELVNATSTGVTIELRVDSLRIVPVEGQAEVVSLVIDGYGSTGEPGRPVLPTTAAVVGVPEEGEVALQVQGVDFVEQTVPDIQKAPDESQEASVGVGGASEWYPADFVTLGQVGFVREQRIAQVVFYPVRVNQATHRAQVARSIRVAVLFGQPGVVTVTTQQVSPQQSVFEDFFRTTLANYAQARQWRKGQETPLALAKSSTASRAGQVFKIIVEKDGFYQVTGRDLQGAGAVLNGVDPRLISLTNKGQPVPVWVTGTRDGTFDPQDAIRFRGDFNRGDYSYHSPYTPANVYWLTIGEVPGAQVVEVDGGLYDPDPLRPASTRLTRHFEEDLIFERLLLVSDETADHWFWMQLQPGSLRVIPLRLDKPATDGRPARVKVRLRGLTYPSYANPDHHVVVKLNGWVIGDVMWDGQAAYTVDNASVPASALSDGENALSIELPGDTGAGDIDLVLLDWIEVEYDARLEAVGNRFQLQRAQGSRRQVVEYRIGGLTRNDALIIDAVGRRFTNLAWEREGNLYRVTFQDRAPLSTTYYLLPADGWQTPAAIVKDSPSQLRDPGNSADYVIITHADFMAEVERLAEHRRARGLRTMVVDVADVYDEFGDGSMDPRAIKRFLQYAYEHWAPPRLSYVLLVGDCTYGFDKEVARGWKAKTYVPTMLEYTTTWGILSSDNYFACVSGTDVLPDLYIGRLPVASAQEAGAVVAKIIQYERYPLIGQWRRQLGLITGTGTATRNEFEMNADYLQRTCTPPEIRVRRLSTDTRSPHMGSTEDLVRLFEEGTVIMNFIGHGGGGVFSDEELFQIDDVNLLNNTMKFPVLFSLTCFIGYFDSPTKASLGEELLRVPGRGIVAHFGSAGRARLYGDQLLNIGLFKSLFAIGRRRVGQVTTEGKLSMLAGGFRYPDEAKSFNLMGDPALEIALPRTSVELSLTKASLSVGEVLSVSGTVAGGGTGMVLLEVVNDADSVVADTIVPVSSGRFQADLAQVTTQFAQHWQGSKGVGVVRAYFWDEQSDGIGAVRFRLNEPHFVQVYTEPARPAHMDSVYISAQVVVSPTLAPGGITGVSCEWSRNSATWTRLVMESRGEGLYRTVAPLQVEGGARVYYRIVAEYSAGELRSLVSEVFSYDVIKSADVAVTAEGMTVSGTSALEVRAKIANTGDVDSGPFALHLFDVTSGQKVLIAPEQRLTNLAPGRDTIVTFVCANPVEGLRTFRVVADSAKAVKEQNRGNNSAQRTRWIVLRTTGTGAQPIEAEGNFSLTIPPQAMSRHTAIAVSGMPLQHFAGAGKAIDLVPVRLKDGKSNYLYALASDDSTLSFSSPYTVATYFDPTDTLAAHAASLGRLKLYAWDKAVGQWVSLNSQIDLPRAKVTASAATLFSVYGLFVNVDSQAPTIRLTFQGQTFAQGDFVPAKPNIVAIVEDQSPVDNDLRPVRVVLDGRELAPAEFSCTSTPDSPNMLVVGLSPNLHPGQHELQVTAYDVHGNKGVAEATFTVSENFALRNIANHPNPFSQQTVIAFTLTAEAEEVQLRVYSTSGRLVRDLTREVESVIGYTEVVWDGTDEEGEQVANGVYYLKLVAKRGRDKIETIEKVARLR
ncbi:MAG: C25 family cysteine peptidase [candidate division KSB1 bacterium]|nr:C25 family cysteine peptidase [candidate division KSB1 bacterium]